MRVFIFAVFSIVCSHNGIAQSPSASLPFPDKEKSLPGNHYKIEWGDPVSIKISDSQEIPVLYFSTAQYAQDDGFLPRHYQDVDLDRNAGNVHISLINTYYEPLPAADAAILQSAALPAEINVRQLIHEVKKQMQGGISFIPLRKNAFTGEVERLVSFDIQLSAATFNQAESSATNFFPKTKSILQTGTWFKIAVTNDGIYKLSYDFFKQHGIDVIALNPKNIRIYGNGGGMLPKANAGARADDLVENAIVVEGENDGVFNKEDVVLFYGQGPLRWRYTKSAIPGFEHITHLYSDTTYYFLNVDLGAGKRIAEQPSSSMVPTHIVNSFNDYALHENDDRNLFKTGSTWYGEYFDNISSYDFAFQFPYIESAPATVKVAMAATYDAADSKYTVSCQSGIASFVVPESGGFDLAKEGQKVVQFVPSGPDLTVQVKKETDAAIAWLDYIEVNVRRKLSMVGDQMKFRDVSSAGPGHVARYTLETTVPTQVWDVTDPLNIYKQQTTTANLLEFVLPADTVKEFIAFTGTTHLIPQFSGKVDNQNLHAISQKDFIIVSHPDFLTEANQLAAIHEKEDKLSTVVVTTQQIYNEFSSGCRDITAIRDFVRMFYKRATTPSELPKYLLLIGDGSYDNKREYISNTNFIPAYESPLSTNYVNSFVSDDFYGLLDDAEGIFDPESQEAVDIGVGRFPVKSKSEAQAAINKVIQYIKKGVPPNTANNGCSNNQSSPFGDWRNMICLVADDEDDNRHMKNTEKLATILDTAFKTYNVDKIYLDAYQQESTPGGERYPDANDAIEKRVEKGCLIFNYSGHGGEVGLAHERVLNISTINKWSNFNNMPLFFTATCEFSRYDDPGRTAAGEYVFLNPKGAAIALFTTVRQVFETQNAILNESFMKQVFKPLNNEMPRLGDIFQAMKSETINLNTNSRGFSLLGDPALRLAYPKYDVVTDSVNEVAVSSATNDTLTPLSHVTISGHIENNGAVITNYNGVLYPTVFNTPRKITTLSNNQDGPYVFMLQKDVLYKGKASVVNGRFKYEFIVPKDIAYQYGVGRISYYAENGSDDGNGYHEKIIIGGTATSTDTDHTGPEIELYMNDSKFIYGGTTNEKPDVFAVLRDENGINTVGNGIGHDIIAVLDANTEHSIVLNDFYQSDLNSYKSGTIRYPLKNISEGKHTLTLKAWDVYNNSSLATTEFVVSSSSDFKLDHVLNYPNPFTTNTKFFFEHNQCCQFLTIQVQVFTISGKLVKTINKYTFSEGYRTDPLEWDGRDDFGDRVARGVYVYRLKIKNSKGASAEKFEKLVVLN